MRNIVLLQSLFRGELHGALFAGKAVVHFCRGNNVALQMFPEGLKVPETSVALIAEEILCLFRGATSWSVPLIGSHLLRFA